MQRALCIQPALHFQINSLALLCFLYLLFIPLGLCGCVLNLAYVLSQSAKKLLFTRLQQSNWEVRVAWLTCFSLCELHFQFWYPLQVLQICVIFVYFFYAYSYWCLNLDVDCIYFLWIIFMWNHHMWNDRFLFSCENVLVSQEEYFWDAWKQFHVGNWLSIRNNNKYDHLHKLCLYFILNNFI